MGHLATRLFSVIYDEFHVMLKNVELDIMLSLA